ncbi:MAG: homoaconitase [FCB group bacterium]|nr:homoaconitase [FCB group bacterium]
MSQNLIEKIIQRFAVGLAEGQLVHSGDYISIQPAHVLTHDNTGAVMLKFKAIGAGRIANPRQPVFALDHNVQDHSEKNLEKYKSIENFAREMGVDFYPAGRGIGHQIMCEEGYVLPGTLVVASDSHANMYGALGALGTPVVRSDAAALWATGRTWWQIPPVTKIVLEGSPNPGVTGKDIILTLCGFFRKDEVLNHALEFVGEGVSRLSVDDRLTIANMTTEWGALAGVFPTDERTKDWFRWRKTVLEKRTSGRPSDHPRINTALLKLLESEPLNADPKADYAQTLTLELDSIQPVVTGPDTVKTFRGLTAAGSENIKIDKAYLVSCVNSRADDLAAAAAVVKNRKVAEGVEFYIAAASDEVQQESETRGDWQILCAAGAIPLPPGCGPCIGLGAGLLGEGEVGISATNRNFKGRMGAKSARAYLASPATVAASAVAGRITSQADRYPQTIRAKLEIPAPAGQKKPSVAVLKGFPRSLEGEAVFCTQDNLNTDGIFPGKYTYLDDFPPERQAEVVMENYDPQFVRLARDGDILVGGYNFGTGSSREQAATALKYKGIRLVIAASFSETFKRNAINNGFLVIRQQKLVEAMKSAFHTDKHTLRTGWTLKIDFIRSIIVTEEKSYAFDPVGTAAQELIAAGGLGKWVSATLNVNDNTKEM